jgi:hypothetical protein
MKKTLYICGDSFCTSDPEYGASWTDLFSQMNPEIDVRNFSSIGASNYLVYLQVKEALAAGCDYLIFHATSSVRQEFVIDRDQATTDSVDRYWRQDRPQGSMRCNSFQNVEKNLDGLFSWDQRLTIKEYFADFFDFAGQIEKNYVFIYHTLNMLDSHKALTWAWSRGGFEHSRFAGTSNTWDFSKFADRECPLNLWDHYVPDVYRPHFHVNDPDVVQNVCNSYQKLLKL